MKQPPRGEGWKHIDAFCAFVWLSWLQVIRIYFTPNSTSESNLAVAYLGLISHWAWM